jgi:hypothetical protein
MNKTKPQVHEFIFENITSLAVGQEKRPFFTMSSLKYRDFKDRCHPLNYFQGFNNSLRP